MSAPHPGPGDEVDFGLWHEEGQDSVQALWRPHSGELVAVALTGSRAGQATTLAWLPESGHPNPRRRDLIAEAALAGWTHHSGHPGSLAWLRGRLSEVASADLQTIDWTAACPTPGCPRHNEAIAAHSPEWGETCDRCLSPRTVTSHALTPAQLEARLRAGAWHLADRATAPPPHRGPGAP